MKIFLVRKDPFFKICVEILDPDFAFEIFKQWLVYFWAEARPMEKSERKSFEPVTTATPIK